MERAPQAATEQEPHQRRVRSTPRTKLASFVITELDVGSAAVRPGAMAEIEEEREILLLAAKLVLGRIKVNPEVKIGAVYEHALEAAVRMVETGQR